MKQSLIVLLLQVVLLPALGLHAAGEAWYLEMPLKHADFLIEAALEDDKEAYEKIVDRIPALIQNGTITEIERFKRDNTNPPNQSFLEGDLIPKVKHQFEGAEHGSGSHYSSREHYGEMNLMFPKAKEGMPHFRVITLRRLGTLWMPTLRVTAEQKVRILLERDPKATVTQQEILEKLELRAESPDNSLVSVTWFVSNDGIRPGLRYEESVFGKNRRAQGPRSYGFLFSLKSEPGQTPTTFKYTVSTEFVNLGKGGTDEVFRFYQRDIPSIVSISDPFDKVVTSFAKEGGLASDSNEGKHGKFTLAGFKEPIAQPVSKPAMNPTVEVPAKAPVQSPPAKVSMAEDADGWIDLLGQLTPELVKTNGHGWTLKEGELFSPKANNATLSLPGNFAGSSYHVRVKMRRIKPNKVFYLALPVGDRMTGFGLDGMNGQYTALMTVNFKSAKNSPGAVAGTQVKGLDPHILDLMVKLADDNVSIRTKLNDEPLYQWSGKVAALKKRKVWATSAPGALALGSTADDWAVSEVKVRRLDN